MLFLLILVCLFVVDIGLYIADKYWWSFLLFAGTIAGSYFVFPEVTDFIGTHSPWTLGLYYLIAGVVTAAVKWVLFNVGVAMKLREHRTDFETSYKPAPVTSADSNVVQVPGDPVGLNLTKPAAPVVSGEQLALEKRQAFVKHLLQDGKFADLFKIGSQPQLSRLELEAEDALVQLLTPRAKHYVERITGWVAQWPIVIITTIFEDLFVKLGKHLARLLDACLRKLSAILIGGAVKGL